MLDLHLPATVASDPGTMDSNRIVGVRKGRGIRAKEPHQPNNVGDPDGTESRHHFHKQTNCDGSSRGASCGSENPIRVVSSQVRFLRQRTAPKKQGMIPHRIESSGGWWTVMTTRLSPPTKRGLCLEYSTLLGKDRAILGWWHWCSCRCIGTVLPDGVPQTGLGPSFAERGMLGGWVDSFHQRRPMFGRGIIFVSFRFYSYRGYPLELSDDPQVPRGILGTDELRNEMDPTPTMGRVGNPENLIPRTQASKQAVGRQALVSSRKEDGEKHGRLPFAPLPTRIKSQA